MQIFSWIGNVFGYLLWFFYEFTKNYGVSIILFTIVLKIIMFPFSIKQQKSMAKNTRLQGKQKEIQKKYGDNKQKMSEEMQKLYQQEGVNPMGGCLTSIVPLIIMMGIYYSVVNPLQNTLHIAGSKVTEAMQLLQQVPGVGNLFSGFYGEIDLVKHFDFFKDFLPMFSADEAANIAFDEAASAFTEFLFELLFLFIMMGICRNPAHRKGHGGETAAPAGARRGKFVQRLFTEKSGL